MRFAFISRDLPTQGQIDLALDQGIDLVHVGDADAFSIQYYWVEAQSSSDDGFDGVVVVHPAAAMRLCADYLVGVFENANRAEIGQPTQFEAVAFHIYDMTAEVVS